MTPHAKKGFYCFSLFLIECFLVIGLKEVTGKHCTHPSDVDSHHYYCLVLPSMSCLGAVRQQTAECPVAEHELKLSSFFREPTKQFCVLQKEAFQLYNHRWKSNNIKHWKQTTNKRKATQQGIGRQIGYQQSNNQTKRQPYMSKGTSNKQKRKNWREKIGWASAAPLPQYHYVFFSSKVHSKPWKKRPWLIFTLAAALVWLFSWVPWKN